MRMQKILANVVVIFLSLFAVVAYAEGSPVAMLQSSADHMIAGLKSNQATIKTKPQIVYNLAYKYIVPNADLAEMSRRVVPPHIWNSATSAQRVQFEAAFTKTLIRTYATALTAYSNQSIKFYPVRGGYAGARSVVVNSQIVSPESSPIRVSYQLINANGRWKLIDLSVEGVSMLESFRAQFSDILSQGNMNQLLQRMHQHNNRS